MKTASRPSYSPWAFFVLFNIAGFAFLFVLSILFAYSGALRPEVDKLSVCVYVSGGLWTVWTILMALALKTYVRGMSPRFALAAGFFGGSLMAAWPAVCLIRDNETARGGAIVMCFLLWGMCATVVLAFLAAGRGLGNTLAPLFRFFGFRPSR